MPASRKVYKITDAPTTIIRAATLLACFPLLVCPSPPMFAGEPRLKVISICDLFRDLESFSGRLVAVRGELYKSREIFALHDPTCKIKFTTSYDTAPNLPTGLSPKAYYEWPTALDLKVSYYVEEGEQSVDFKTDQEAMNKSAAEARRCRGGGDPGDLQTITLTVIGQLRTRKQYFVGHFSDGSLHGDGYGHLGIYPGQLVIKTVLNTQVMPCK